MTSPLLSDLLAEWEATAEIGWARQLSTAEAREALAALAEAEQIIKLCAADTTAPDLAQEIEFMKAAQERVEEQHAAALAAAEAENARLRVAIRGAIIASEDFRLTACLEAALAARPSEGTVHFWSRRSGQRASDPGAG